MTEGGWVRPAPRITCVAGAIWKGMPSKLLRGWQKWSIFHLLQLALKLLSSATLQEQSFSQTQLRREQLSSTNSGECFASPGNQKTLPPAPEKKTYWYRWRKNSVRHFLVFIEQCFSAHYGGLGRCVGNLVPRPLVGREEERPLKRGWGMWWMGGNVEVMISLGTYDPTTATSMKRSPKNRLGVLSNFFVFTPSQPVTWK